MTTLDRTDAGTEGLVLLSLDGVVLAADPGAQELVGPLSPGDPLTYGGRLAALRLVLRRVAAAQPGVAVRSALVLPSGRTVDVRLERTGAGNEEDVLRVLLCQEGGGSGAQVLPAVAGAGGHGAGSDVFDETLRGRYRQWRTEHDVFTGLLSGTGLSAHLEKVARAGGGALAHFDIDDLGEVNRQHDSLGGDLVILAVARAIEHVGGPGAGVARVGGDEFGLALAGVTPAAARGIVADVLAAIREPIWTPTGEVRVTASAGLAEVTSGRFPHHALHRAISATFLAKRAGGDQVVVEVPEVTVWATDRMSLMQWVYALQHENEALAREARTDALTGLPNRRALEEAQSLLVGAEYPVGVLFVDIDRFGDYNHLYGDSAGDRCLSAVSRTMVTFLRTGDQIFRKGGEEFVVLLPGADAAATRAAGERIRSAVAARRIVHAANEGGVVTITAGVAVTDPDEHPAAAVERGARAVYASKISGQRNRVH